MKKIQVRNIPDDVYFALEQAANNSERSIEGEVRYALRNWVTPPKLSLTGDESYRQAVSDRLNVVLKKTNQYQQSYDALLPSHIAAELGMEDLGVVANWFSGHELPSLSDLKRLSKLFGCCADWLIHGEGNVYGWGTGYRLNGAGRSAVKSLLEPDSEGNKVSDIFLLREDDSAGAILIIRQFVQTRKVDVFWTNLHLSEVIGTGGESDLADFFVTLRALYQSYVKLNLNVKSYMFSTAVYKKIREEEQAHPLMLIKDYRVNESPWWEDVWDKSQRGHFSYWEGDVALINRIESVIKNKKYLLDEIDKIKNPGNPYERDMEAEV
jgi:hypothetical protein